MCHKNVAHCDVVGATLLTYRPTSNALDKKHISDAKSNKVKLF